MMHLTVTGRRGASIQMNFDSKKRKLASRNWDVKLFGLRESSLSVLIPTLHLAIELFLPFFSCRYGLVYFLDLPVIKYL